MNTLTLEKIRQLKSTERNKKIVEIRKMIFELKLKQATRQPVKTHLFKQYKRMLAQILTIEHQYQKSINIEHEN